MEIRNNAEALKAFLGVPETASSKSLGAGRTETGEAQAAFSEDEATFSHLGTALNGAAAQEGVRLDRVAAVQGAIAAGTYSVPAAKVADKLIDAMLITGAEK